MPDDSGAGVNIVVLIEFLNCGRNVATTSLYTMMPSQRNKSGSTDCAWKQGVALGPYAGNSCKPPPAYRRNGAAAVPARHAGTTDRHLDTAPDDARFFADPW